MIRACDLTRSSVVDIDGTPHRVETITVQSPSARGGATLYKVRFRNVVTKNKVDKTFKGDDALKNADLEFREIQYLYKNGDQHTFLDLGDYSQFDLTQSDIEEQVPFLIEDMEGIKALMSDGRIIGIELPDVVEMEIVECEPSIRGATATARTKPATLVTGLTVQVPEYMSQGEIIRVDTRTGAFLSRA